MFSSIKIPFQNQILDPLHFGLEKIIHAFILLRLDYCNSLLSGTNQKSLTHLLLVQNAAARCLACFNRHHHITPFLASLQWLPLHFRINFKILLFTFKALQGRAPSYITELLTLYEPSHSVRSSGRSLLVIPKLKLKSRGGWTFSPEPLIFGTACPRR